MSDYLQNREKPLKIEVFKGSIDRPDVSLQNTDAVIGIEIIEHLENEILENVPKNIFGFIKPKIAIFTTPNSEYNVLFDLDLPNGFRHLDHKFEWTRKEFKNWCLGICTKYTNYLVSFYGIGKPPPERKDIGHVSQMAIFIRKDVLDIKEQSDATISMPEVIEAVNEYELLSTVDYPYDNRDRNTQIYDEVLYQLNRLTRNDRYQNDEKSVHEIPLKDVHDILYNFTLDINELRNILQTGGLEIVDDVIIKAIEERGHDDTYEYTQYEDWNIEAENDNNFNVEHEDSTSEHWD